MLSQHHPPQPRCHSVPEVKCLPREVETPRTFCHQEYDEIVDTVYTEHCEEVITTTCQQTSVKSIITRQVVGHDSKVVATGVVNRAPHSQDGPVEPPPPPPYHHLVRREAEDSAALLLAELGPAEVHETPAQISQPVCDSVPVKECGRIPTQTPRRVARTVCQDHLDITTIEDCQEVITTQCHHTGYGHPPVLVADPLPAPVHTPFPAVQAPVHTPFPAVQAPVHAPFPAVQPPVLSPIEAVPAPQPSVQAPVLSPVETVRSPIHIAQNIEDFKYRKLRYDKSL